MRLRPSPFLLLCAAASLITAAPAVAAPKKPKKNQTTKNSPPPTPTPKGKGKSNGKAHNPSTPQTRKPRPRVSRRGRSKSAPSATVSVESGWLTGRGGVDVAPGPHALSGFHFRFGNGDHKLKTIGVQFGGGEATPAFADNDGNDGFKFKGAYHPIPGARVFQKRSDGLCSVACDLAIEKPRADEVFVLVGFEVDNYNKDANFIRLAVRPSPERGQVRVEFRQPPFGVHGDLQQAFSAKIQYAYIPRSRVATQARTTGVEDRGAVGKPRVAGAAVLQGFDLFFTDADGHHLESFGITPETNRWVFQVNDGNPDDSYRFLADYAILTQ
ncbi:MAG: hypothetical protein AAF721_03035 [Myxococcota bacterium]